MHAAVAASANTPGLAAAASGADLVPLVVDLDGTLLRTDTLVESLLGVARRRPWRLPALLARLRHGRAAFKQAVAAEAPLDLPTLPVSDDLLAHLQAEHRRGRRLVLATGADQATARAAAARFGCFERVLASDGTHNLSGVHKRERLLAEFGAGGFDYAGNSWRDLPVWAAARRALLVSPSPRLAAAAARVGTVERVFAGSPAPAGTLAGAMRVHHWLKNLLLLVPLLAAHRMHEPQMLLHALVGALSFSLAASGVYLVNDLLDLPADRAHPRKRHRALASGQWPIAHALALLPVLWGGAAALAAWVATPLLGLLAVYVALMLGYSLWLKDIALVDVLVLAIGYTLRVHAGAVAVDLPVSGWLLVCSAALFFSLALLKRYAELVTLRSGLGPLARVRAYRVDDAALIAGLGCAAGTVAVAVLALYPVADAASHARWPVWLMCAMLLFWTGHLWLMAHRGQIADDPVSFALHDRTSQAFGAGTLALLVLTA